MIQNVEKNTKRRLDFSDFGSENYPTPIDRLEKVQICDVFISFVVVC